MRSEVLGIEFEGEKWSRVEHIIVWGKALKSRIAIVVWTWGNVMNKGRNLDRWVWAFCAQKTKHFWPFNTSFYHFLLVVSETVGVIAGTWLSIAWVGRLNTPLKGRSRTNIVRLRKKAGHSFFKRGAVSPTHGFPPTRLGFHCVRHLSNASWPRNPERVEHSQIGR